MKNQSTYSVLQKVKTKFKEFSMIFGDCSAGIIFKHHQSNTKLQYCVYKHVLNSANIA